MSLLSQRLILVVHRRLGHKYAKLEGDTIIMPSVEALGFRPDPRGLGSYVFRKMKKFRNNTCQIDAETGESFTYAQTLEKCVRTALHLRKRGLKRSDFISEIGLNHINSRVPYVAALFLNAQYSFIDPRLPASYSVQILMQDKPKFVFVGPDFLQFAEDLIANAKIQTNVVLHGLHYGKGCDYEKFEEYLKPIEGEDRFKPCKIRDIYTEYLLMSTSGSTGIPSRICLSHYSLMAQSFLFCGMRPKMLKVLLSYPTLFTLLGAVYTFFAFLYGITLIAPKSFDVKQFWSLISKYKVSFTFLPTSYASVMYKLGVPKGVDVSEFKEFCFGGSIISKDLAVGLRKMLPHVRISPCYGQTEMGGVIVSFNYEDPEILELAIKHPTASGSPIHGIHYRVKDIQSGEVVGVNKMGELYLKSKFLMLRYLNKDMKEFFDSEGWYKTGDLVMYDEDLCFYVIERLKVTYLYKGFYVAPALIEMKIQEHPSVEEVAVVPIPNTEDVNHSLAFVKLKKKAREVTPEDIINFVKDTMEEHYHLRGGCVIVDLLPRTPTGKIDVPKLKENLPKKDPPDT